MTAEGAWESERRAEEVDRTRLTIVLGEDRRFRAILRGQIVVDARDRSRRRRPVSASMAKPQF